MHPAFSVIFFTTASGAGYGLLALLGCFVALRRRSRRIAGFGARRPRPGARRLIAARPAVLDRAISAGRSAPGAPSRNGAPPGCRARAWRAVATFVPAGLFGIGWVILGRDRRAGRRRRACSRRSARSSTVVTTGMIYASLKPIAAVAQPLHAARLPDLLAAMTGAVLLNALLQAVRRGVARPSRVAPLLADLARLGAGRSATWRHDDALGIPATANSATGLGGRHGALDRVAAHRRELPAEGDGLPHRPQARASSCAACASAGLRPAACNRRCLRCVLHGPARTV